MNQRTVKGGAQKKREKKLAKLQRAAAQSYSLTNYFSCTSIGSPGTRCFVLFNYAYVTSIKTKQNTAFLGCYGTSEHGQPERSGNVDNKIDEEDAEGVRTY